ncbi:MAG: T9SS type A sorting domain-containing protein, partial [Bacteroidota bacterium]
ASNGGVFEVTLSAPNGLVDENPVNNQGSSTFDPVMVFEGKVVLNYTTNARGFENFMQIKDHAGQIVLSRTNMANNTNYIDELDLIPGCYTLEFFDSGDDGLYYWYWDAIGLNIGGGQLRFRKELTPGFYTNLRTFHPEFGRSIQFDFVLMDEATSTEEETSLQSYLSVYPNPSREVVNVEWRSTAAQDLQLEVVDAMGRLIHQERLNYSGNESMIHQLMVGDWASGVYFLKVHDGKKVMVRQVVRE